MTCPRCGANQSDDVKFCTACGANLHALREVLVSRELDTDLTLHVKRYNEIKAGVITSSAGLGIAIFLYIFMQGVAANAAPHAAEILTRVWVAGLIPFLVGLALILNGVVVSKKQAEIMEREIKRLKGLAAPPEEDPASQPRALR